MWKYSFGKDERLYTKEQKEEHKKVYIKLMKKHKRDKEKRALENYKRSIKLYEGQN